MTELEISKKKSIVTLKLNRPEKRNALNDNLINELKNALGEADTDENLRAIIITGAGKDFCSGADLSALQKIADASILENLADAENLLELLALIRRVKVPVIAAVRDVRSPAAAVWQRLAIWSWRQNRRGSATRK